MKTLFVFLIVLVETTSSLNGGELAFSRVIVMNEMKFRDKESTDSHLFYFILLYFSNVLQRSRCVQLFPHYLHICKLLPLRHPFDLC